MSSCAGFESVDSVLPVCRAPGTCGDESSGFRGGDVATIDRFHVLALDIHDDSRHLVGRTSVKLIGRVSFILAKLYLRADSSA